MYNDNNNYYNDYMIRQQNRPNSEPYRFSCVDIRYFPPQSHQQKLQEVENNKNSWAALTLNTLIIMKIIISLMMITVMKTMSQINLSSQKIQFNSNKPDNFLRNLKLLQPVNHLLLKVKFGKVQICSCH